MKTGDSSKTHGAGSTWSRNGIYSFHDAPQRAITVRGICIGRSGQSPRKNDPDAIGGHWVIITDNGG
jgi:hypothetical protein